MKIALVTLGCDKNTVDAEHLAGLLESRGHEIAVEGPQAKLDVLVVTTCGFIRDARDQSLETIRACVEGKVRFGNPRRLIVAGCLSQRSAEELAVALPEVDAFTGVGRLEELADLIERLGNENDGGRATVTPSSDNSQTPDSRPPSDRIFRSDPLTRTTRPLPRKQLAALPYAYLKIADGCDHACSFCAIPAMKGSYVSVPREFLLEESRGLVASGVREIVLIAQDLVPYGRDLYEDYALPDLLKDLCRIEGDFRIRLLYFYPAGLTPRFLEVFASEHKICKYLDMPLQHLDARILKAMRRPAGDDALREKIRELREKVPGVVLRTAMIVGFPGETSAAFENLTRGVREIAFDWLGVFRFSPEAGAPAAEMSGQVSEAVARRREDKLLRVQQRLTAENQARQIGRTLRVLIESVSEDGREARGRSYREAPEVDGEILVRLDGARTAPGIGDFVDARITGAETYDLIGEIQRDATRP